MRLGLDPHSEQGKKGEGLGLDCIYYILTVRNLF